MARGSGSTPCRGEKWSETTAPPFHSKPPITGKQCRTCLSLQTRDVETSHFFKLQLSFFLVHGLVWCRRRTHLGKDHVFVLKYDKHGWRCLEVSSGSTPPDVEKQAGTAVTSFGSIHHLTPPPPLSTEQNLHLSRKTKSAGQKPSLSLMSEKIVG